MIVRTAADEFSVVLTVLDPSPFYDVTVRAENPIGLGRPSTVRVDMAGRESWLFLILLIQR